VRRDYAKARYEYLINRLRLKQATGTLAEADLEAIDRLLK
jgi:outer membrane protein